MLHLPSTNDLSLLGTSIGLQCWGRMRFRKLSINHSRWMAANRNPFNMWLYSARIKRCDVDETDGPSRRIGLKVPIEYLNTHDYYYFAAFVSRAVLLKSGLGSYTDFYMIILSLVTDCETDSVRHQQRPRHQQRKNEINRVLVLQSLKTILLILAMWNIDFLH